MKYTYSEILRRLKDVPRKGWAEHQVRDLIDTLWRDEFINRTSGFDVAGGPDSSLSFDPSTRILKIEPVNKRFAFWQFIFRIAYFKRMEPEEIELPDQEGLYLVYFFREQEDPTRKSQKLFLVKNPTEAQIREVYLSRVSVAWIYWDATGKMAVYLGDERHGSQWNPQIHWWAHGALNALWKKGLRVTGLVLGDGSLDDHARFGIEQGEFFHEDMEHAMAGVSSTTGLPVLWFSGNHPRVEINPGYAFLRGIFLYCNAGGAKVQVTDKHFVIYHVFATNCLLHPLISVMGPNQYAVKNEACKAAKTEMELLREMIPQQTVLPVASVVFEVNSGFTNSVKARIVEPCQGQGCFIWIGEYNNWYDIMIQIEIENNFILPEIEAPIITQPGHGFEAGVAIRHNGVIYIRAQANNDINAQVCGIVSGVIDPDNFRMVEGGYIPGEWIPGKEYILSPWEAGKIIVLPDPEVWAVGQVRLSLGWGTTLGLKVEIDVGDVISQMELPTAKLQGYWDREFEFCVTAGIAETFDIDLWAVYEYSIIEAILESDGTLNGVSISIGSNPVGGLSNMEVATLGKKVATSDNTVTEGNRVTLSTSASYSGSPFVIKGKLKILRQ